MSAAVSNRPVPVAQASRFRRAARKSPATSHGETAPARRELDTIGCYWQAALDTAGRALDANATLLKPAELVARRRQLTAERQESASLLRRLARARGIEPAPWLPPFAVTTLMLGIEQSVRGCVFDLDGVLTDSGVLHAAAWATVFDAYLLRLSHDTGRQFIPFDRENDYRTFVDGRLRVDGVHAFLASRGIRVPEGVPDDDSDADTAHGLARRKGEQLQRGLRQRGVAALPGARRYLQAAGYARLSRAVVSASGSTLPMLELIGLGHLVDAQVDALAIRAESLRARPAPDVLLAACRRLGLRPDETVTVTHSGAGVVAGQRAGLAVIGIGVGPQADLLRDLGAEHIVPSLTALLDPRLADAQLPERRRQR